MKKIFYPFTLFVSMLFSGTLQAQVTIGSNTEPNGNAILDLKNNANPETSTKGLLLPRVELESTALTTPLTAHVKGMVVYNTKTANDITPGYYYNDGTKWSRVADASSGTWYNVATGNAATENSQNIYQTGSVGIQTGKPSSNAGLHVSERKDPASTTPDYYNGVLIPRYTETERDANFNLGAADNGMRIFNITTDCTNTWVWSKSSNSGSWIPSCGEKPGKVEFTECSTIKVTGKYDIDNSLSEQTVRIDVPVKVTELGNYFFSTNTVNGVSFEAKGTFVNLGTQTVSLYVSAATSPITGRFNYTVKVSPTESAGNKGKSCDISVDFISRATSILKVANISGDQNYTGLTSTGGNYYFSYSYAQVGDWLSGGNYAGANSARSYGRVANVEIIDVSHSSMSQLQSALQEVSIVWIGASQSYSYGFAQLIREWFNAGNGIVMITGDKLAESTVADALGYYIEVGNATSGRTVTSGISEVFTSPFNISDGVEIGYSGGNSGYVSSNSGVKFIEVNGNPAAYADILNGAFIFGDKFGSTTGTVKENFTQVLIDIFAWSLANAPIK